MIYYYGDVEVTYGNVKLTADYMEYDMNSGTVFARGTLDTLTGVWKGQPTMTEGGATYSMEELRYNFNSRKAKITNMMLLGFCESASFLAFSHCSPSAKRPFRSIRRTALSTYPLSLV